MRILLDECVPVRLRHELPEHDVSTVRHLAWHSLSDRELVQRATGEFDAFITVDQSLQYQQVVSGPLVLLTVVSGSIEFKVLRELVPQILDALERARPGDKLRIGP